MLQGTLDLLILKTLAIGPAHGHTIAHAIEHGFDGVFIASDGDECAYLSDCSTRASRIVARAHQLLQQSGHEPQRLKMAAICSVCAEPFTRHVEQFGQALAALGPSAVAS